MSIDNSSLFFLTFLSLIFNVSSTRVPVNLNQSILIRKSCWNLINYLTDLINWSPPQLICYFLLYPFFSWLYFFGIPSSVLLCIGTVLQITLRPRTTVIVTWNILFNFRTQLSECPKEMTHLKTNSQLLFANQKTRKTETKVLRMIGTISRAVR